MTDANSSIWTAVATGTGGAIIGWCGNVIAAMFGRRSALDTIVDNRIKLLLAEHDKQRETDRATIEMLRKEIEKLEGKIDHLTKELEDEKKQRGLGI